MIRCAHCGTVSDDDASLCLACGRPIDLAVAAQWNDDSEEETFVDSPPEFGEDGQDGTPQPGDTLPPEGHVPAEAGGLAFAATEFGPSADGRLAAAPTQSMSSAPVADHTPPSEMVPGGSVRSAAGPPPALAPPPVRVVPGRQGSGARSGPGIGLALLWLVAIAAAAVAVVVLLVL